jgi:hypothetical protein
MTLYQLFPFMMILVIIITIVSTVALRGKTIPVKLFFEAVKNENKGDFEAAIISYENALNEVKKGKLHDSNLENKIIEKIKVLHTAIDYQNNLQYTR